MSHISCEGGASVIGEDESGLKASFPHPLNKVDSSNGSNFPWVVDEHHVSFGGGVELEDLNVAKAPEELGPYLCSEPVSNSHPHVMLLVIFSLR